MVGRNFDYEVSYNEEIITIERNEYDNKYSMIGVCTGAVTDYPLLYDGMNEYGLVCGGLAFTGNAKYQKYQEDKLNIPSFDFTFQVLGNNKSVNEVIKWLSNVSIWCEPYSDEIKNSDLHWFIADKENMIIVEQTDDGLHWYFAETGVMTNNPPYPEQLLSYKSNKIIGQIHPLMSTVREKEWFSRGRETDGLLGGYSSDDRFEKASYLLDKMSRTDTTYNSVAETFHILESVMQLYGLTPVDGKYEYTIYSVVYDIGRGLMWIRTYDKICPNNYMIKGSERIPL